MQCNKLYDMTETFKKKNSERCVHFREIRKLYRPNNFSHLTQRLTYPFLSTLIK